MKKLLIFLLFFVQQISYSNFEEYVFDKHEFSYSDFSKATFFLKKNVATEVENYAYLKKSDWLESVAYTRAWYAYKKNIEQKGYNFSLLPKLVQHKKLRQGIATDCDAIIGYHAIEHNQKLYEYFVLPAEEDTVFDTREISALIMLYLEYQKIEIGYYCNEGGSSCYLFNNEQREEQAKNNVCNVLGDDCVYLYSLYQKLNKF